MDPVDPAPSPESEPTNPAPGPGAGYATPGPASGPGPGGGYTQPGPGPGGGYTQPAPRRLVRSRTHAMVGGVAAGLGEHLGISRGALRIIFVVLTFTGGVGILLYLLGWVLIPAEGADHAFGDELVEKLRRGPAWLPVVGLVAIGLIVVGRLRARDGVFWAVALIAAGIWLYYRDATHGAHPTSPPPGAPGPAPASPVGGSPPFPSDTRNDAPSGGADPAMASSGPALHPGARGVAQPYTETQPFAATQPLGRTTPAWGGPQSYQSGTGWVPAPVKPRNRSPLARYTLAGMLVVLGVAATLSRLGKPHLAAAVFPGLALLVVAAGLLVGSFWGRSRGLIVIGALLIPVGLLVDASGLSLRGGVGERVFAPVTRSDVAHQYSLAIGQMRLNLNNLHWSGAPLDVRARMGTGDLEVAVPDGVTVNLVGHVGAGEVLFFNQDRNGTATTVHARRDGPPGSPVLNLNLRLSFGHVGIVRAARSGDPTPAPSAQAPIPTPTLPTQPAVPSPAVRP